MTQSEMIDRYCNYLTLMGRSPLTVSQYETDLKMFFSYIYCVRNGIKATEENMNGVPMNEISLEFVKSITSSDVLNFLRYVTEVRRNKSAARARKLSSIKAFYKYHIHASHLCESNPAESIGTPKIEKRNPKYLTVEESMALLDSISEDNVSKTTIRDYAMIVLFLNSGIRLSELVGISLSDLDRELRSMRVIGKGNKERLVYINEASRKALAEYLTFRNTLPVIHDKNALFLSLRGDRISNKTVQYVVKKYLSLSGLEYKHFSTHKLRHTAATLMYQSGKVDIRVLKDILGHEQLNTTQIYTHTSDAQMMQAMDNNPLSKVVKSKKKKKQDEGE